MSTESEFEELVRKVSFASATPAAEMRSLIPHAPALAARIELLIRKRMGGHWLYPGEDNLLFYGLFVLAAARARTFWPVWASMLTEAGWSHALFGDGAAESGASISLGLAADAPDDIAALAGHPGVPEPVRVGLLNALARLTCEGAYPRAAFLDLIDKLAVLGASSDPEARLWAVQEAIVLAGLWERLALLERLWALFPDGVVRDVDREETRELTKAAARNPTDMRRFEEAEVSTPSDPTDGLQWLMRIDERDLAAKDALDWREREWLTALLNQNGTSQALTSFEALDGFFHALALGPEPVLPSRYLPAIFGEGRVVHDDVQTHRLLALLQRHWNAIATRNVELMEPVLAIEPQDGHAPGQIWTQGFVRGVSMCAEAWEGLRAHEDATLALGRIIDLAQAELDLAERYKRLDGLTGDVMGLGRRWLTLRAAQPPAAIIKVGRYTPCPCGSGLTWKICCGAPDKLH